MYMRQIFLCGHTGSMNRGCEAIIRGTAEVLKEAGLENMPTVFTFDKQYDEILCLDEAAELVPYCSKSIVTKVVSRIRRDVFGDAEWGNRKTYGKVSSLITENSMTFNVGGDTYCYGTPYLSIALNKMMRERNVPNVFWGCSVEENVLNDSIMREDIGRYSYIVPRETLSYETIRKCVGTTKNVFLACDPAFYLPIKETRLPQPWMDNNMVGINLSPMVMQDPMNESNMTYENFRYLIERILAETDMGVCLVPHVYNIEQNLQDSVPLRKLYARFSKTERVSIVDSELSCTQLKYIISKCRFFIGARTHATIAAYSTRIPTIAISYSVKSRGIARDLFEKEDGFAVSWKSLNDKKQLWNIFDKVLLRDEDFIRNRYKKILPEYKKTLLSVTEKLLQV